MNRTIPAIAVAALAALLTIAGCGGGSGYGSSSSESEASYGGYSRGGGAASSGNAASGGGAVVSAAYNSELGRVLVDSRGFTVYDFERDKGATSSCYGACAKAWPPLITEGKPQGGNGAPSAKLGTTERKDGSFQVTFAGHPLYTYVNDTKPGEANGNDVSAFGASWYALTPSGENANG